GRPRARAHDAELFLEQGAAVSDGRLSDLRRRGGLDVQRGAADRPHARADRRRQGPSLSPRQLPRKHQGDDVSPDSVRGVRVARAGDKTATQRYLAFISAGGSKYPIDLLKDAGVDMTTSEPLNLTMKKMNRIIDEMEAILTKMGK